MLSHVARALTYPVRRPPLGAELLASRQLIAQLTGREVVGRYKGSALGIPWSLHTPQFMLAVCTLVLATVFSSGSPGTGTEASLGIR